MVRAGKACIVISSEMPGLVGLADRVLVMRAGRIVAELRGDEVNEENVVVRRHDRWVRGRRGGET